MYLEGVFKEGLLGLGFKLYLLILECSLNGEFIIVIHLIQKESILKYANHGN